MTHKGLTIIDVLKDPLIRLMMRADRVSLKTMKTLLVDAARKRDTQLGIRKQQLVAKGLSAKGDSVTHSQPAGTDAQACL